MTVKSDRWIIRMARDCEMIRPFSESQVKQGISYGVSSYGYDISLSREFKILDAANIDEIDPKQDNAGRFQNIHADSVMVPANSFILARTQEYFKIPRKVIAVCLGKSTYARCGIIVNVTPFEPEWEGYATISLANTSPVPVRVYAGEGIAQVLFLEADRECLTSYRDKKGKYQSQREITLSKAD